MKRFFLHLAVVWCLSCATGAAAMVEFLVAPGASISREQKPLFPDEAVSAAETVVKQSEEQLRTGTGDAVGMLNARILFWKAKLQHPQTGPEDRGRLLDDIRKADGERMKLIEARYRNGLLPATEYRTAVFRMVWERLEWDDSPENTAAAVKAAEVLKETVLQQGQGGVADRAQSLLADITCAETRLRQLSIGASGALEQVTAVHKLYEELIELYAARAEYEGASSIAMFEATLAALKFARACASHVYRNASAVQELDAAIRDTYRNLLVDYSYAELREEITRSECLLMENSFVEEVRGQMHAAFPEKTPLIQRIISLPDNWCYEEHKADFIERLYAGEYRMVEGDYGVAEFLKIGGDGCIGQRMFILSPKKELCLLSENWEEGEETDSLSRYLPGKDEWETCSDDVPKEILEEGPEKSYQKLLRLLK